METLMNKKLNLVFLEALRRKLKDLSMAI